VATDIGASATDSIFSGIVNTPLGGLGKDFVAEQVAKNGATIINNVDTAIGNAIGKPVRDLQNLVFDSIAAVLTAKNDMIMFFLQQVARNAITGIQTKRDTLLQLQEKLRQLYNALVILGAGNPFFSKYLLQLRSALTLIDSSRSSIITVRNTLQATDRWLSTRFAQAKSDLKKAETLLQPPGPPPDVKITDPGLLSGVGVTSEPQQLTVLLAVPQLVQEVLAAANGYTAATFKVNALLLAFNAGYSELQSVSSTRLKDFSVSTLDNLVGKLDELVGSMAATLNGGSDRISTVVPGFVPEPVKASATSLSWLMQLKVIIEYINFVPGPALTSISVSNAALASYTHAVDEIKKKDNRGTGVAILTATDGREDTGQLESQLTTYTLAALKAIVDAKVSVSVLSLGRALINRLTLSLDQDREIEQILQTFVSAPLAAQQALNKTGNGVFKMLNNMGLDRAAALLQGGSFTEFFNLNTKTATFVGAALVGIGVLKECAESAEDQEQLVQAERELQRDQTAKELLSQRGAATGFSQQKLVNDAADQKLSTLEQRAVTANSKCALPNEVPTNLLAKVGPVLGVGLLGGTTLSKELAKLGRGIL
jgi:hypothetical protein